MSNYPPGSDLWALIDQLWGQSAAGVLTDLANPAQGSNLVAFRQTGIASAPSRTLQLKNQQSLYVEDGSADPTGTSDASILLQRVLTAGAGNLARGPVRMNGIYLIDSADITVPNRGQLDGGRCSYDSTDRAGWMTAGSTLIMNPAYKMRVQNGAGVRGIILRKKGLDTGSVNAAIVATYAGTGIEIVSSGIKLSDLVLLGFEWAIRSENASNTSRTTIRDIQADCTNGLYYANDLGGVRISGFKHEPILTSGDFNNARNGTGIFFDGDVDNGAIDNCFLFGNIGFHIKNSHGITSFQSMSDGPRTVSSGIGLLIEGDSTESRHIGWSSASKNTGVKIDAVGALPRNHFFTSLGLWQNNDHGMLVVNGNVYIDGGFISRTPANYPGGPTGGLGYGIHADGPNAYVRVDGVQFNRNKVALKATNGARIDYGPGCVFINNTVDTEGDVFPY